MVTCPRINSERTFSLVIPSGLSSSTHACSSVLLCICFPETWHLFLSFSVWSVFSSRLCSGITPALQESERQCLLLQQLDIPFLWFPKHHFAFLHCSKYPVVMELSVFLPKKAVGELEFAVTSPITEPGAGWVIKKALLSWKWNKLCIYFNLYRPSLTFLGKPQLQKTVLSYWTLFSNIIAMTQFT